MHEVAVNIDQAHAVRLGVDQMIVPDLVIERARLGHRFGHLARAALAKEPVRMAVLSRKMRRREVPARAEQILKRSPMRPPVAPYLTVSPAFAAITFYTTVFGARQKTLMPSFDGLRIMHCELSINGGSVMLADAFPEFGQT